MKPTKKNTTGVEFRIEAKVSNQKSPEKLSPISLNKDEQEQKEMSQGNMNDINNEFPMIMSVKSNTETMNENESQTKKIVKKKRKKI